MAKIVIVTGFTDAGKTTLIQKLIDGPLAGSSVGVITNDRGINVLKCPESVKEVVIENGCLCCTLFTSLKDAWSKLYEKGPLDYIFIEAAGMASPLQLLEAIEGCKWNQERIEGMITLVEASFCQTGVEDMGAFYTEQIKYADYIVLTHEEECEPEELEAAKNYVKLLHGNRNLLTDAQDYETFTTMWLSDGALKKKVMRLPGRAPRAGAGRIQFERT